MDGREMGKGREHGKGKALELGEERHVNFSAPIPPIACNACILRRITKKSPRDD